LFFDGCEISQIIVIILGCVTNINHYSLTHDGNFSDAAI